MLARTANHQSSLLISPDADWSCHGMEALVHTPTPDTYTHRASSGNCSLMTPVAIRSVPRGLYINCYTSTQQPMYLAPLSNTSITCGNSSAPSPRCSFVRWMRRRLGRKRQANNTQWSIQCSSQITPANLWSWTFVTAVHRDFTSHLLHRRQQRRRRWRRRQRPPNEIHHDNMADPPLPAPHKAQSHLHMCDSCLPTEKLPGSWETAMELSHDRRPTANGP